MSLKPTNPKDLVGIKKPPLSTLPPSVLLEVSLGMLEGARKYGRYNWRAIGIVASVYYDAALRHLMRWWEGEDLDPDSGIHHVSKAIAGLMVLRDGMLDPRYVDDRPPRMSNFSQFYKIMENHARDIVENETNDPVAPFTEKDIRKD